MPSEQVIDRNLTRLACTRVVAAHRLSTVHNADQIVVLEDGRIVERGTAGELAALGDRYAALVGSDSSSMNAGTGVLSSRS